MTEPIPSLVSKKLRKELKAASGVLYESSEYLSSLAHSRNPDTENTKWIIKQAYLKIQQLAKSFDVEL